jgi:hypothetical protein
MPEPADARWLEDGYSTGVPNTPGATPALRTLLGVVPVVGTRGDEGLCLVVPSVERYAEGFLVHAQLHYRVASPDDHRLPEVVFEATDDLGNSYGCWAGGGYGGGSSPTDRMWRRDYVFRPALEPRARELRLRAAHVEWQRRDPESHRMVADETRPLDWLVTVPLA